MVFGSQILLSNSNVVIINYDMGNLCSISNALEYLGYQYNISSDEKTISCASHLILPGVGSFRKAIEVLKRKNLFDLIISLAKNKKKILGICLGFQLLGKSSNEDGNTEGLGLIDLDVRKFTSIELQNNKIPHIGFNEVILPEKSKLFEGLKNKTDFYFVHSFKFPIPKDQSNISICHHGVDFMASYENENIFGVQFHPEKSQTNGLKVLSNFLKI